MICVYYEKLEIQIDPFNSGRKCIGEDYFCDRPLAPCFLKGEAVLITKGEVKC